jgi:hypothetical protein
MQPIGEGFKLLVHAFRGPKRRFLNVGFHADLRGKADVLPAFMKRGD